jgi:tetrahydromethanopterin S-methyltransferase subunit E
VKLHANSNRVSQFRKLSHVLVKKTPTCGPTLLVSFCLVAQSSIRTCQHGLGAPASLSLAALLACWLIILGVVGSSFSSLLANRSRRLCLLGRGIARAMAGLAHRSRRCWLMCLLGLRMAGAMAGWSIVLAGGVVV